ncbi:MAG: hypothetical protein ABSA67_13235 [Candidatus Brocadiia bacterium]|jgi:hypothetical protein
MTKMLERAFKKAASLPKPDQDALAEWLLQELESETRWQDLFTKSQDGLSRLAAEALEEHRLGKTKRLDPGK